MRFPTGRHRFTPRLTTLDERSLPSVTVGPVDAGGSVVIRGDHHANTIDITDDGAGNVSVTADGTTTALTGVSFIKVYGGNGADNVTYTLQGDLSSVRGVFVNLGNQSDTFLASLQGNLLDGGSLSLVVQGGNGNDDISVDATTVDIAPTANLTAVLQGGNGSDSLAIDYSGLLQGSATLAASGGNGKDTVTGNVNLFTATTAELHETTASDGRLTLDFEGGNAPDKMTLNLSGEGDLSAPPVIQFNGGRGKDSFTHTDNVTPADDAGHGKNH